MDAEDKVARVKDRARKNFSRDLTVPNASWRLY